MCHNIFSGGKYPGVILRVTEPNVGRKPKLDKLLKPESLLPTSIGMKAVGFPVIFLGRPSRFLFLKHLNMLTISAATIDKGVFSNDATLVRDVIAASMSSLNLGNDLAIVTETVTDSKTKKDFVLPVVESKNGKAFVTVISGSLSADGTTFNKTGIAGWLKVKQFAD